MARRVGGGSARRVAGRTPASFSSGQEPRRKTPPPHANPKGAPSGCPSLWLLSLGQARESDSGAKGVRKLWLSLLSRINRRGAPRKLAPALPARRRGKTSGEMETERRGHPTHLRAHRLERRF